MNITNETIVKQVLGFVNKVLFIEKKKAFEYRDVKLYPSEIHLILLAHQEQATNATIMAEKLGVTKGAVSQTLSRLEKKGILRKIKDPYNKNELTVEFTTLGQQAIVEYLKMMAGVHQKYEQHLVALTDDEREVISRFLSHLTAVFDEIQERQ